MIKNIEAQNGHAFPTQRLMDKPVTSAENLLEIQQFGPHPRPGKNLEFNKTLSNSPQSLRSTQLSDFPQAPRSIKYLIELNVFLQDLGSVLPVEGWGGGRMF